jgi:DNA-binding NarL/FixJ family response regulator
VDKPNTTVAVLSGDLFLFSRLEGAAKAKGYAVVQCGDKTALLAAANNDVRFVLIDLKTPAIDLAELVPAVRKAADTPPRVIAYGPHVHAAAIQVAQAAGCDQVLTQGQLHRDLNQLFD